MFAATERSGLDGATRAQMAKTGYSLRTPDHHRTADAEGRSMNHRRIATRVLRDNDWPIAALMRAIGFLLAVVMVRIDLAMNLPPRPTSPGCTAAAPAGRVAC